MPNPAVESSAPKKASQKAEAIMNGAMQEFLVNGYAATSMDRIAQTAQVSKATIYSHFRDKSDLFAAIIQQLATHKFNTLFDDQDPNTLQGEPRVVLHNLAIKICGQAHQNDQFCEFMRLIIGESGRFPELAKPYIENLAKPVILALTQYLNSRPDLHIKDPEATARTFIGTLVYFVMLQNVLHGQAIIPMSQERQIETLIDLIVT